MPAIFESPEDDRSFRQDGYVVVDFLNPQEIETLLQAHLRIEGTSVSGFYSSWFRTLEVRAETDRSTRAVVGPKLKKRFPEYRMAFGTFMSKGCEGETTFPLHQDPSIMDEGRWTPLTFWIPLVDVDVNNGCMHAVPGSHLFGSDPRPSFAPFPHPELQDQLRQRLRPIPMRAGQVLIFHSALIHASPENRSGLLRVATAGVLIPESAQLQFCRRNEAAGVNEVFAVDDFFYLRVREEDSTADLPKLGEYPAIGAPLDLSFLQVAPHVVESPTTAAAPLRSTGRGSGSGGSRMATKESRVALLCIDPLRQDLGDFKPFNYSVRKVQAAVLANPSLHVEVKVFEYESKNVEEFVAQIEAMDPDIIGASAYVWSFPTFYEVARLLKRARPDRLIVFGGPSARMEMFKLPPFRDGPQFVDALVLGEGEEVFQEIVGLEDRSRARLRAVPGIAASTGDGWFLTPARDMPVLDTLASPFQMGLVGDVKTAHLETFRGCPLSCTFCQWGDLSKANRVFSVEYLVRELGSYVSMGLRSVMIVDAALNLNLRAFRNLCIAEREVGFFKKAFLHAEIYPQYLNEEHLSFLREVGGGLNLGLGLQSYNKGVLGNVERPFDEARFERVVGELLQITPRSEIEIIMGLPGDDPESFRTTLHRALGLGASVRVYHCLVLPNALMSRAPASFEMKYDIVDLSMISCLGWKDGAIQRMSEELTSLTRSIPGAFLHNDGFGWHFPSLAESKRGEEGWHFMLSDTESLPKGESASGRSTAVPLSIAGSPASDPASASVSADGPAHLSVDPELRAALAAGVSRATAAAWELVDAGREEDLLTLKVGTPFGELLLDVRPAIDGANSFKVVDGTAYSYRRPDSDMPAGAFKQLESVIAQLRPLQLLIRVLRAEPLPASRRSLDDPEGNGAAHVPVRTERRPLDGAAQPTAGRSLESSAPVTAVAPRTSFGGLSVRDLPKLESLSSVEFDAESIDLGRAARVYADVGFIVVRGLLRSYMEPMLAEIRQAVELAYRELPEAKMERHGLLTPSGGVFSRVGGRQLICAPLTLPTSPTMRSYASDRLFVSLLDELLAREVHLIGSGQVMYKVADGGVETGLHQDASYTKDFGFKEVIAAFTYVVPTTIERGCIWLVPYSHRLGLLPHQEEGDYAGVVVPGTADWEHAIPIPGNPGDTLLWHFNVLHGSQPNLTAEDRPAVVIRYGRRGDAEVLAEHGLQDW